MVKLLSQEDIEHFFDSLEEEGLVGGVIKPSGDMHTQIDRMSQLRAFRLIHDNFVKRLEPLLKTLLHTDVEMQLHTVDQVVYSEFLETLPEVSSFNTFTSATVKGVIELSPSIMFSMIDRILGGMGEPFETHRNFTDMEYSIIGNILDGITNALSESWKSIIDFTPNDIIIDSAPNSNIISYDENVLVAVVEVVTGYNSGMMNICYPVNSIPSLDKLDIKNVKTPTKVQPDNTVVDASCAFDYLKNLNPKRIFSIIRNEHPQIIALILCYMDSKDSAKIMECFSLELSTSITMRIYRMGIVSNSNINTISDVLERKVFQISLCEDIDGISVIDNIMGNMDSGVASDIGKSIPQIDIEMGKQLTKKIRK